jgi:hypothetical protein
VSKLKHIDHGEHEITRGKAWHSPDKLLRVSVTQHTSLRTQHMITYLDMSVHFGSEVESETDMTESDSIRIVDYDGSVAVVTILQASLDLVIVHVTEHHKS